MKRSIRTPIAILACISVAGCGTTGILLKYRIPETTRHVGILVIEGYDGTRPINTKAEYGATQTSLFQQSPVFKLARIGPRYHKTLPEKYYKTDLMERVAESTSRIFINRGIHAEILNRRADADQTFGRSIDATVHALSGEGDLDAVLLIHLSVHSGVSYPDRWQTGITLDTDSFFYELPSKRKLFSWTDTIQTPKDPSESDELLHEEAVKALAARLEQRFP